MGREPQRPRRRLLAVAVVLAAVVGSLCGVLGGARTTEAAGNLIFSINEFPDDGVPNSYLITIFPSSGAPKQEYSRSGGNGASFSFPIATKDTYTVQRVDALGPYDLFWGGCVANPNNPMVASGTVTTDTAINDVFCTAQLRARSITVTKQVIGTATAPFDFGMQSSAGTVAFQLSAGGSRRFFLPTSVDQVTISETVRPGFTVSSQCTWTNDGVPGSAGPFGSVAVVPMGFEERTCVFTNTGSDPPPTTTTTTTTTLPPTTTTSTTISTTTVPPTTPTSTTPARVPPASTSTTVAPGTTTSSTTSTTSTTIAPTTTSSSTTTTSTTSSTSTSTTSTTTTSTVVEPTPDPATLTELTVRRGDPLRVTVDCAGELTFAGDGVERFAATDFVQLDVGEHDLMVSCDGAVIETISVSVVEEVASGPGSPGRTITLLLFVCLIVMTFVIGPGTLGSSTGRRSR